MPYSWSAEIAPNTEVECDERGAIVHAAVVIRIDDGPCCTVAAVNDGRGGYFARSMAVENADGSPVTGTTLRSVRVSEMLQRVASYLLHWAEKMRLEGISKPEPDGGRQHTLDDGDEWFLRQIGAASGNGPADADWISELRAAGPSSRKGMYAIAKLYRIAERRAVAPNKFIQEVLAMSPATASHWVKLTRAAGHLPPSARKPRASSGLD
ncbi:hypothetical protein [Arthrobacter sp. 179]|uniref:hypothetical protein n=1 Tax=Arthrobacter sp. 179 TaxID=3457734 RepID=UPI00403458A1